MPPIFANDYSSLQASIQGDQARREAAIINSMQMMIGAQREQQRRRELRDSIMLHQQQQDIANRMAQQTFAEQVRQFNVGNQTHQDDLNFRRQAMTQKADVVPPSVQAYNKKVEYELAQQGLYNGEDPDLMALSNQAIAENNKAAAIGQQIAGADRRRQLLAKSLTQSQQTVKDIPWWRKAWSMLRPNWEDPTYTEEEQRQGNINEQLQNMPAMRPQDVEAYTLPSPATGFRQPLYDTRTNGVPMVNRRMLNMRQVGAPATNQTQTVTSPNPYAVGKRYGNLRYIGGDPNLETSWQPVQ